MRSIVTDRVAWSVGLSVTLVSPAETVEPIDMPFGFRTRVGPGSRSPHERSNVEGERGRPIVTYMDTLKCGHLCKKRLN